MRINAVTFEAFRGFQEERRFEFPNANVIILHGPNGFGKTSFFDAIEWGLTGAIYRYEEDTERKLYRYIGNHFAQGRNPRVTLELSDENTLLKITRTGTAGHAMRTDDGVSSIEVEVNGVRIPDEMAEEELKRLLVHKEWQERTDVNKSLFLTHLLCQERMNGILRGMKEKDRYHAVSRIFGTEQFSVYRDIVHKAKALLEVRRDDFQRKLVSLKADKAALEERFEGLQVELADVSQTSRHSQWQSMLQSFHDEFQPSLSKSMPREIKEWVQEAQSQSDRLELERRELENVTFRELELAKDALASLQDKLPQLKQWEHQYHLANSLNDRQLKVEQLQYLFTDTDAYQEAEQTMSHMVQQADQMLTQAQQIRSTADQLREALESVTSLVDSARIDRNYDGLSGVFAMKYPSLVEAPRVALFEVLREFEGQWYSLMECEKQYKEAERNYDHHSAFVQQLVQQEEKHEAFLKHVLQVATDQPALSHCPACGTDSIHADHLQKYASSQLDRIHPELATAEMRKLKLDQTRQASESRLQVARMDWVGAEATLHDVLMTWRQHHSSLLTQETDAREKHIELNQQVQQMGQRQENYRQRAAELEIDIMQLDLKERISSSLQEVKQQASGLQALLATMSSSFSAKPLLIQYEDIHRLRDDIVVWNGRLTAAGIVGADTLAANWQAIEEQLAWKTNALEAKKQENARRQAIPKQLLTIYRTDRDLALLDELQKRIVSKQQMIQRVDEGLRTLEETFDTLKDAESKVPDAVNALTERVMDQMFDTLRAIFVRINSHPLFTNIDYDTDKKYNNNRLLLKVMTGEDSPLGLQEANPSYIFSAAQVNATAISFFLAMSLTQSWSPLQFVAMDDPVQSMDDLNAVALIDLIRDLADPEQKSNKQFIISTHDSTFYQLMRKKFRVLNVGIVEYNSYSEAGPTYEQRLIEAQVHQSIAILAKSSMTSVTNVERGEGDHHHS